MDATPSDRVPTNEEIAELSSKLRGLKQELLDEGTQICNGTSSSPINSDLIESTFEAGPMQAMAGSSTPISGVDQDMPKIQNEVHTQGTSQELAQDSASLTAKESDVSDVSGVTLPMAADHNSVEEDPSKQSHEENPMHALITHRDGPIRADIARLREMLKKVEEELDEYGVSSDMSTDGNSITADHAHVKHHLGSIYENLRDMALICVRSQAEVSLQLTTNLQLQMQGKALKVVAGCSTSKPSSGFNASNNTATANNEFTEEEATPESIDQLVKHALEKLNDIQASCVTLDDGSTRDKVADIEDDLRAIQCEKSILDRELEWQDLQIGAVEMRDISNYRKKVDAERKLVEKVREFHKLRLGKAESEYRLRSDVLQLEHHLGMVKIDEEHRLEVEKANWKRSMDFEKAERQRDLQTYRIIYVVLLLGSIWGEKVIGWLMKIF